MKGIYQLAGIVGAILFMAKVIVHWYLIFSATGEAETLSRYGLKSFKYVLPVMQKVDEKHQPIKLIANLLYYLSLALGVIFLIDYNLRPHP